MDERAAAASRRRQSVDAANAAADDDYIPKQPTRSGPFKEGQN
jgi:hypothetical protein